MTDTIFQQIFKNKLIETYKLATKFLDKHNLRWYGAYGTVLGAVRHKGIIPWDDDIDIYMPREDYNKLINLKSELEKNSLKYVSCYTDKNYFRPFAKITNTNTTIWERARFPFVFGIYIDIFPLDTINEIFPAVKMQHKLWLNYQNSITYSNLPDLKKLTLSPLVCSCKRIILGNKKYIQKKLQQFIDNDSIINQREDSSYYIYSASSQLVLLPKQWFDKIIEIPFEDTTIKIPDEYDEYLTLLYGDYMTPPPINKRISNHHHMYINLQEGLSIEEVRKRMKKGETCVY